MLNARVHFDMPKTGGTFSLKVLSILLLWAAGIGLLAGIVAAFIFAGQNLGYGSVLAALIYVAGFVATTLVTATHGPASLQVWLLRTVMPLSGALAVFALARGMGL